MKYIYMMEIFSAIKRNTVLIHPATWVHLENTMLSEKSQTKKKKKKPYLYNSI